MKLFLIFILLVKFLLLNLFWPNLNFSSSNLFNKLFLEFLENKLPSEKSVLLKFILFSFSKLSKTVSWSNKYRDSTIDFIRSSEIGIILLFPFILLGEGAQLVKNGSISVLFISTKAPRAESLKNFRSFFILNKYLES